MALQAFEIRRGPRPASGHAAGVAARDYSRWRAEEKKIVFYTIEARNSVKTKDRSCKVGEKRASFCAGTMLEKACKGGASRRPYAF